ncbi:MAG: GNAT family N-acetyltransferase [Bacillota bacterium]|nr:GNAT family N-acetyltransferase [Bacillota bacterium]
MMIYRTIQKSDNPYLAELVRSNLKQHGLDIPGTAYFDLNLEHLYEYYTENPEKRNYFVAEDETGKVVGGCGIDEFAGADGYGELQKLYVDPDYQRQGIARALVGMVEEEAARLGYKVLYLETHSNLQAALHLYQAMGFELVERPAFAVHATMDNFMVKAVLDR